MRERKCLSVLILYFRPNESFECNFLETLRCKSQVLAKEILVDSTKLEMCIYPQFMISVMIIPRLGRGRNIKNEFKSDVDTDVDVDLNWENPAQFENQIKLICSLTHHGST